MKKKSFNSVIIKSSFSIYLFLIFPNWGVAQTEPTDSVQLYQLIRERIDLEGLDRDSLRVNEAFLEIVRKNQLDIRRVLPVSKDDSLLIITPEIIIPPDSMVEDPPVPEEEPQELLEDDYDLVDVTPQNDTIERNLLAMVAKSYGDSIVLRWAPNNALFWGAANYYGYALERFTVDDTMGIMEITKLELAGGELSYLKPWSLDSVSQLLTRKDSFALMAAQMVYGSSFDQVEEEVDIVKKSREFNNRYGFSLLTADISPKAADFLGLRYVDKNVEDGLTYLYILSSPADTSSFSKGYMLIKNKIKEAPKPTLVNIQSGDHLISIYWDRNTNSQFSTFWLERSDDNGETYQKLHHAPLLLPNVSTGEEEEVIYFEEEETGELIEIDLGEVFAFYDSIDQNYKTYKYRLKGVDAFGDESEYTEFSAQGKDLTPPPVPIISQSNLLPDGRALLIWENEEEEPVEDLAGYRILKSTETLEEYSIYSEDLPRDQLQFISPEPLDEAISHYFKVEAFDDKGNKAESFPVYVHVVDSIAPAIPTNILSHIDSNGVVTLGWDLGDEVDLAGYRVYFSNDIDYEFTQLTDKPIEYNFFQDTVEVQSLTEKVYYQIQAIDDSHNRSEFSEIIEVQKPDIIPPVVPLLHAPEMNDTIIVMHWTPSSSEDVESHEIYRKRYRTDEEWELIHTANITDTSWIDNTAEIEQMYTYSMRAVDDAGLYSDYAFPVKARRWFDGEILTISDLKIIKDTLAQTIQLDWQFEDPVIPILRDVDYRFYLYKSQGEEPVIRYKQLNSVTRSFTDKEVKQQGTYNYAVKVIFRNGKSSPLSEVVSIEQTE